MENQVVSINNKGILQITILQDTVTPENSVTSTVSSDAKDKGHTVYLWNDTWETVMAPGEILSNRGRGLVTTCHFVSTFLFELCGKNVIPTKKAEISRESSDSTS